MSEETGGPPDLEKRLAREEHVKMKIAWEAERIKHLDILRKIEGSRKEVDEKKNNPST